MTHTRHEEVLKTLTEIFADRVRRPAPGDEPGAEDTLASVQPSSSEEVGRLAEVAARYSVPVIPLGAGTGFEAREMEGAIIVHFDLMRGLLTPRSEEAWIEAEPGVSWLQLEDSLRPLGRGLVVYPTSAPRATVGGWLARDGLGVGSFEYGWLRENVLTASVVLVGGGSREVSGAELGAFLAPGSATGIVVGARLKTRRAEADVPFAATFTDAEHLSHAVAGVSGAKVPLWHLAFLNPPMSRSRGLGESHLLFGAYPRERETNVAGLLGELVEASGGHVLGAADAYRVWGERFFPVAPSRPTPVPTERLLTTVEDLSKALERLSSTDVQGTVARSGEVLLLAFDVGVEDGVR
ncbi:MAG TPA: FAD-binding oxidoreductase [Rubrobacter sp.]|nr:FAD-binding oxidoreductase [Rubrobacter sp.]